MSAQQEQNVLAIAETIERAIDDELDRIDMMDENDLASIRKNRVKQLKEMAKRKELWISRGHGQYQHITDPKEFFEWAKRSERCVIHFGRPTERCNIIDAHLRDIAPLHFETLFARVDCEKLPTLPAHFNVIMLPSIMLIEGGNTFHTIIGFDEFGAETLKNVLKHYGMINEDLFAADQTQDE